MIPIDDFLTVCGIFHIKYVSEGVDFYTVNMDTIEALKRISNLTTTDTFEELIRRNTKLFDTDTIKSIS